MKAPLRPADGVIAAVCAAGALLLFVWLNAGSTTGEQVVVRLPDGAVSTYALDQPRVLELTGRDGLCLTVEIAGGAVRVSASDCPDHICMQSGTLSRGGQSAVCVPAGITVQVVGGDHVVDGVTS